MIFRAHNRLNNRTNQARFNLSNRNSKKTVFNKLIRSHIRQERLSIIQFVTNGDVQYNQYKFSKITYAPLIKSKEENKVIGKEEDEKKIDLFFKLRCDSVHKQLSRHLLKRITNYHESNIVAKHTDIIVGAENTGKSTTLKSFINAVPFLYGHEKIIPLYINCKYFHQFNGLITDVIYNYCHNLKYYDYNNMPQPSHICNLLKQNNKKLIVIIDEAEELWSKDEYKYYKSLYNLRLFAYVRYRSRCNIILCGSSNKLPYLVNAGDYMKDYPSLIEKYPLIATNKRTINADEWGITNLD